MSKLFWLQSKLLPATVVDVQERTKVAVWTITYSPAPIWGWGFGQDIQMRGRRITYGYAIALGWAYLSWDSGVDVPPDENGFVNLGEVKRVR